MKDGSVGAFYINTLELNQTSFVADVITKTDYYPFGMAMPGRTTNSQFYKYGLNGVEKDDEVKGYNNSYGTYFRHYDPRLARWTTTDPVVQPWQSPYAAFDNNPIYYADPMGDEAAVCLPAGMSNTLDLLSDNAGALALSSFGTMAAQSIVDINALADPGDDKKTKTNPNKNAEGGNEVGNSMEPAKSSSSSQSNNEQVSWKANYYTYEDAERALYEEYGYNYEFYKGLEKLVGLSDHTLFSHYPRHEMDFGKFLDFYHSYLENTKAYNDFSKQYAYLLFSDKPWMEKYSALYSLIQKHRAPRFSERAISNKYYELNPRLQYMQDE